MTDLSYLVTYRQGFIGQTVGLSFSDLLILKLFLFIYTDPTANLHSLLHFQSFLPIPNKPNRTEQNEKKKKEKKRKEKKRKERTRKNATAIIPLDKDLIRQPPDQRRILLPPRNRPPARRRRRARSEGRSGRVRASAACKSHEIHTCLTFPVHDG